jgi:hypothetical protein
MTTSQFSLEFDILYDNINSQAAPGIDEYEKSVYLTKAQLEIIKEYNDLANKYQKGFDQSEKRRTDLKELLVDAKITDKFSNTLSITTDLNAAFFEIPDDVFLIKFERAFYTDTLCNDEEVSIPVVPITLDEYNESVQNPFRKPYKDKAWRIDYSATPNINKTPAPVEVVEIISSEDINTYHMRYLKYPLPIILTDLEDFYEPDVTLYIDGLSGISQCELSDQIHPEILDRAVELATRDYKDGTLASKVELNKRNN